LSLLKNRSLSSEDRGQKTEDREQKTEGKLTSLPCTHGRGVGVRATNNGKINVLKLLPGQLTKKDISKIFHCHIPVHLHKKYFHALQQNHQVLQNKIAQNEIIYGVNTGFGFLANKIIAGSELKHLQENLLHSHAAGVGSYADEATIRLTLLF